MKIFPIKNKEDLHHAYILEGSVETARPALSDFLKDAFGVQMSGNPDVFIHDTLAFGVDDATFVIDKNSRKSSSGQNKFIIISLNTISHQAQNSLLKTLEEPTPGTHIFIIAPTASSFLPTIKSRVHVVSLKDDPSDATVEQYADTFLRSNHPERLEIIKAILSDKEKEKINDSHIAVFVRSLEKKSRELLGREHGLSDAAGAARRKDMLKAFVTVSEYLYDTSSSKKMLLEYIALRLPVFRT